jgi:hypothetical protein
LTTNRADIFGANNLAYVYFENPGGRSASKLLSRGEARRISANIAKLPERRVGAAPQSRILRHGHRD